MNQTGDHMKMNFEHFQIQKWTLYVGKSRWKNGVICLVSMLPSWVAVLKLSKKCVFCNFVLTSVRNLSRLKQFTYKHLIGLVTHFQELVLFIMLWLTVSEVWVFEVGVFWGISAESAPFLIFKLLISHERWLRPL